MKKKPAEKIIDLQETLSLDKLVPKVGGSIFLLARIAMMRAIEVYDGSRPLVPHLPLDKATTIALKEISAGKVTIKLPGMSATIPAPEPVEAVAV